MGVPKFFRYISERYPNLSELVGSAELPQFDNMYLDMNGIIHVCSHPDDSNVHFRMTEEQMFRDILHYIDTLFHMIQPRKLFFMAVDGVAPRAKMNQQRSRRFQSARTALELIEKAKKANEKLPDESRFDSNCITPGTEFMERLQQAFKHFVRLKLSTDPAWKHCRVILSGHETPGEGEHKVMEYIRYLKSLPDYDSNTRHCLYGLDADLVMLGLCTHELNFALLREEVKFDKNAKRAPSVDETRFYLLHLGLLRDYLELEFIELKPTLKFEYDLEKIIDDWVFMCFMVGNDFLPHLPNLHINSNALPTLYKVYKAVLPKLDGYINEAGKLNLERFEIFMEEMGTVDRDLFREHYEDLKFMEQKHSNEETFGNNTVEITAETKSDLADLIKKTNMDFGSDVSSSASSDGSGEFMFDGQDPKDVFADCEEEDDLSDDELFEREFTLHKSDNYINKLKYPEMNEDVLAEQTKCYITGLQWTLAYYYRGVCSWSWYYPHHYAPYMSDVKHFKNLQPTFKLGKPFRPFEQLLSVLPAASKELLPRVYHKLMTDQTSKIIDYYPVDFETDLNGKKQEWEALVLIPFIDELRLMDAMNDCNDKLSESENSRNKHGPMLQYDYCPIDQGSAPECFGQQMIGHVFCKETQIDRSELIVPDDKLVLGPCEGAHKDVYFPGFPTMRHLKHSGKLDAKRIKVFHMPTRNESMIIKIEEEPLYLDLEGMAAHFLNKEVYIGWPHLREAMVVAVSDAKAKIDQTGIERIEGGNGEFRLQAKHVKDHHLFRLGVDLGEIDQLLHVYPLLNREYLNTGDGRLTLSKNWSKIPLPVAPIATVQNIKIFAKDMESYKRIEDVFVKDSTVFLMNKGYYGCQATISDSKFYNGRIKLSTTAHPHPDFRTAKQVHQEELQSYMNSFTASSAIGVNGHLFNRITGIVFIYNGEKRYPVSDNDKKVNVGLQLKHFKQNEEVPGYTKSINNQWLYSQAAVDVVQDYAMKFPKLFQLMNKQSNAQSDPIFESDLDGTLKEGQDSTLKKIQQWMKEQPCRSIARQPCGTDCLSTLAIQQVAKCMEGLDNAPVKLVSLQVKPHLLYKPNLNDINVVPDTSATFELFDRVVIVRDQYPVPLGMRGTIISVLPKTDPNPIRQENINVVEHIYEVLFDKPFEVGTSIPGIPENRVFKVRKSVLINITHGLGRPKKEQIKSNENSSRQRNGVAEKPPPPVNSWRTLDKKPVERKEYAIVAKEVPEKPRGEPRELVNLASMLNKTKIEPNKESTKVVQTEEDILKKMLNLGQNKVSTAPLLSQVSTTQPSNNSSHSQKIALNALFTKPSNNVNNVNADNNLPNLSSLPKPPAAWHQKKSNNFNTSMPPPPMQQMQQQPQFPTNLPMNLGPHMYPAPFFPPQHPNMMHHQMNMPFVPPQHMPPHMYRHQIYVPGPNYPMQMMAPVIPGPQPFIQGPHQVRLSGPRPGIYIDRNGQIVPIPHHSPEGPQKLKPTNGTSSAFIPLQAARKGVKSKSNPNNAPNDELTRKNNNSESLEKPALDSSDQNNKSPVKVTPVKPVPKKPTPERGTTAKSVENKSKEKQNDAAKPVSKRLACNFSVKAAPKTSKNN